MFLQSAIHSVGNKLERTYHRVERAQRPAASQAEMVHFLMQNTYSTQAGISKRANESRSIPGSHASGRVPSYLNFRSRSRLVSWIFPSCRLLCPFPYCNLERTTWMHTVAWGDRSMLHASLSSAYTQPDDLYRFASVYSYRARWSLCKTKTSHAVLRIKLLFKHQLYFVPLN